MSRDTEAWRGLAGGSNEEAARRRPIQVVIQRIAEQVSDISAQYDDMLSEISSFHEQVERYEERTGATSSAGGTSGGRARRVRRANIADEGGTVAGYATASVLKGSGGGAQGGDKGAAAAAAAASKKGAAKTELQREIIALALKKHYLFASLSEQELASVIDAMSALVVAKGRALIVQGEKEGDRFYVIEDGKMDVIVDDEVVRQYEGGDAFGELALMYNSPRAATVRACSEARVWALERRLFRNALASTASREGAEACAFLSKVALLEPLTPAQVRKLSGALQLLRFEAGEVVVRQGDAGQTFYLVRSGCVSVRQLRGDAAALQRRQKQLQQQQDAEGGEEEEAAGASEVSSTAGSGADSDDSDGEGGGAQAAGGGASSAALAAMEAAGEELGQLGAGDYFGELALMSNAPRAATCVALEATTCYALGQSDFVELLGPLRELMDAQAAARVLRAVPLLSGLSEQELEQVAAMARGKSYAAGETILREGEAGDHFYMLTAGTVAVTQWSSSLQAPVELMKLTSGQFFGERALLRSEPRQANVEVSSERVECLVLDRASFTSLLGPLQAIMDREHEVREAAGSKARRVSTEGAPGGALGAGAGRGGGGRDGEAEDLLHVRPERAPLPPEQRPLPLDQSIKLADLRMLGTLGRGTFGRVRLVQQLDNERAMALKIMDKTHIVATRQERNVVKEKETMASSRHPFLLRLIATFQDANSLYMLLELVQGGELWSLLYENTTALPISALGGITMPHAVFYSSIVTCALGDLHQRGIAYRDLKPENLLVDAQGYIKLCDFGFSTPIPFTRHDGEVLDKSFTLCGTPEYLAPELVLGKGHTTAVDYWALGVLIYELLVGGTPFEDEQQPKIFENIVSSQRNLQFPKGLDPHAKSLVRKLLHANPTLRLGALKGGVEDIKCHRFFVSNNLDFEALMRYGVPAPYVPSVQSPLDTTHVSQEDEEESPPPFKGDASIFARF